MGLEGRWLEGRGGRVIQWLIVGFALIDCGCDDMQVSDIIQRLTRDVESNEEKIDELDNKLTKMHSKKEKRKAGAAGTESAPGSPGGGAVDNQVLYLLV